MRVDPVGRKLSKLRQFKLSRAAAAATASLTEKLASFRLGKVQQPPTWPMFNIAMNKNNNKKIIDRLEKQFNFQQSNRA